MRDKYAVNEVFYSLQGEGVRAGTANVFVRFTGCNMKCSLEPGPLSPGGFDCDTEFRSKRMLTPHELLGEVRRVSSDCQWLILTGGEPGLQLDESFVGFWHSHGYKLAVETNGSINLVGMGLDWVTVSPKVAEHCIRMKVADEVKYVRGYGQGIPETAVTAHHYLLSPAFNGLEVDPEALAWCVKLCKENPKWRLSVQLHKYWGVR